MSKDETRRPRLPPHGRGLRIGLLGGSFDPAHEGHRLISLLALRRLRLDRIWWLVSPGNPLKDVKALAPLQKRMDAAAAIARHPRIVVSGVEADLGTRYTSDLIRYLKIHCPGVRFVWLMGADNLASFHLWKGWREIAATVPIAVIDRPGFTLRALQAPAASRLAGTRVDEAQSRDFALQRPPALAFLHGPRSMQSSTSLRNHRKTAIRI
jgi:nicotinate-nucleotide adenylyltransferase